MLRRILPVFVIFLAAALVALALSASAGIRAGLAAEETSLSPSGEVYEINRTGDGRLLVSDAGAQELWLVDSSNGSYEKYSVSYPLRDARMDAAGLVWWTDYAETFGMIDPATDSMTTWDVSQVITRGLNFSGVAFDNTGNVWFSEWFGNASQLHRLDPATGELCAYTFSTRTYSYYLTFDGTNLWLLNWFTDDILRFNPATLALHSWDAQNISVEYQGLDIDPGGMLWFADAAGAALVRLDPATNAKTVYPLPAGSGAEMVTAKGGGIWYTENVSATVGYMDPNTASSSTSTVNPITRSVVADPCVDLSGISSTTTLPTPQTGTFTWANLPVTTLVDSGGWLVFGLPDTSPADDYLGIAGVADQLFVTDQGRQKLVRLDDPSAVPLEVTKTTQFGTLPEPGGTFYYTATVTNPSAIDSATITVITDTYGIPVCDSMVLAPGTATECTFTVDHTGAFGDSWTNTVHVTAVDEDGADVSAVSNPVTVSLTEVTVAVDVEKSVGFDALNQWYDADTDTAALAMLPGTVFDWKITVTNNSDVSVDLTLTDDYDGSPLDLDAACDTAPPASLAVSETYTCKILGDTALAGSHVNNVTADVTYASFTASDSDPAYYFGLVLAVDVEKYVGFDASGDWADADSVAAARELTPGTSFDWKIEVTNNSNAPVDLTLTDNYDGSPLDLAAACDAAPPASLAVGQTYVCKILGDTVLTGLHVNDVTAEGVYGSFSTSDSDPAYYFGPIGFQIYLPVTFRQ